MSIDRKLVVAEPPTAAQPLRRTAFAHGLRVRTAALVVLAIAPAFLLALYMASQQHRDS